jgi:predicted O-methyltransferase YrrM
MKHTKESLSLAEKISNEMDGKTFHHHYHILYDIVNLFPKDQNLTYVEIGCYAGGSSCLILQRPNTEVFAIDLGTPVPQSVVMKNVHKFNIHNNKFEYIQGNSQQIVTLHKLKSLIDEIDVLFIDGDHSAQGVKKDFSMYSPMVKQGGYIVFDDYLDKVHSPQVRGAVDDIVSNISGYEIIGNLPNIFGARPLSLQEGNCFIIKKV